MRMAVGRVNMVDIMMLFILVVVVVVIGRDRGKCLLMYRRIAVQCMNEGR